MIPHSPPRDQAALQARQQLAALLLAQTPEALEPIADALARVSGCLGATLLPAATPPRADALDVRLLDGALCLRLELPPGNAPDADSLAWIDLLDLRLRQLDEARGLRESIRLTQRQQRLQEALYAIADLAHADLDLHRMLSGVHRIVSELTYAENFYVVLYDQDRDCMRFVYMVDEVKPAILDIEGDLHGSDFPTSLTFAVLHGRRALLGPSAGLRQQLGIDHDDARLGRDCIDWLGVPMLLGERVHGAVVVQSYDASRRYSEEDRALLGYVAQHTLTAIMRRQEQARLEAAVASRTADLAAANQALRAEVGERERAQRLQAAFFRIVELASGQGSLLDFFAGVHQVIGELLEARNFFIAQVSDDGRFLDFPYFRDERDPPLERRRMTHGITERVLQTRVPLLTSASNLQAEIDAGELVLFGSLPACWLGVPLLQQGRAVGAMVVQSYSAEGAYGLGDLELMQFASFHVANALERKQHQDRLREAYAELEQRVETRTRELRAANSDLREQIEVRQQIESRLQHQALHDSLTGLPNRAAMLQRLERALASYRRQPEQMFAVLFLDLDRFKVVNDSVGHLTGDQLLIEASRRLTRCVRNPDSVARLGGDEFTVLLEQIREPADAFGVAERILASLVDPVRIGDKEIYTSASIGIAFAHPRYQQPEELLRDADVAMYRAKSRGRQRFEVFDAQLREQALATLDLESDLRRAILRHEFEPHLQPIVDLVDGRVIGYEALLRWRHETRQLLSPADFLSVAEDSGNIEQIDWQLYEKVLASIPRLAVADSYVSINVSARHFRSAELAPRLLALMQAGGVPAQRLRIEITEGALLENPTLARQTILSLREAGVMTLLDDFGTGYSSLSYLHRFPLYGLKIDRSFIAELGADLQGSTAAVVRAIQALAQALGMEVIAEGIEIGEQRQALLRLGCRLGQGFLFARPSPIADVLTAAGSSG